MKDIIISESIKYIGVDDKEVNIFENQYTVPKGMSYNSYLVLDEKNVVIDTVEEKKGKEWLENLDCILDGKTIDYLIISHMEPDHSANILKLIERFPNIKLIGNTKTFSMLPQFYDIKDLNDKKIVVNEGDEISIGKHILKFFMAPMVHWPEVMVTYEKTEKVLFTADAFGRFGSLDSIDTKEEWASEARRYYFNICGKYGYQVQELLKKVSNLDINIICSLHGSILKDDLQFYINLYDKWSKYEPEEDGVFIAYASIHGNTEKVAKKLKSILEEKGEKVEISDLSNNIMSESVANAFKYGKIILASSSYNMGVFTPMEQFLNLLKGKNFQKRIIGIVENGTWAPSAANTIKTMLNQMKDINIIDPVVTVKTTLNEESREKLEQLAINILNINS
ncbi:MAG: FprA family A-type flavoprotein [Clostridia bacterium]|nr:FprA family A-type flavoprotein [Clostridia bacterium]